MMDMETLLKSSHYLNPYSEDIVSLTDIGFDIVTEYLSISGCDTDAYDYVELLQIYVNYHLWQDERVVQFFKYTNND